MSPLTRLAIGFLLVCAGIVLALGFPDADLGWFRGRPLGIVLLVLGVLDVAEAMWSRNRRTDTTLH